MASDLRRSAQVVVGNKVMYVCRLNEKSTGKKKTGA